MTSSQAERDAAQLLLSKMDINPDEFLAEPEVKRVLPTFSQYIPEVAKALSPSTARPYSS